MGRTLTVYNVDFAQLSISITPSRQTGLAFKILGTHALGVGDGASYVLFLQKTAENHRIFLSKLSECTK